MGKPKHEHIEVCVSHEEADRLCAQYRRDSSKRGVIVRRTNSGWAVVWNDA
jgi:hypothetical protein